MAISLVGFAAIKMRGATNKQNSAKLALSTLVSTSRKHAPYGGTLLVIPTETGLSYHTLHRDALKEN